MAEIGLREQLQPALLDRLTDDEPSKTLEPREARLITKSRLRQAVLRDLGWLFNASGLGDGPDWEANPQAQHSVINFGLPPLSGITASTVDVAQLERRIRQAILDFEPRIVPASLQVEALFDETRLDHHNVIGVQIRGNLWAQPVPIDLLLRTDVDLETGEVEIRDLSK